MAWGRYAQQEPELPGTSTVWEYLRFHARLRMPEHQKQNNAAEGLVWNVISQLGLNKVLHLFDPIVQCCLASILWKPEAANAAEGLVWNVISQLDLNKVLHWFDPIVQCCLAMIVWNQKQHNAAAGLVWNVISQLSLNKVHTCLTLLCTVAWLYLCGQKCVLWVLEVTLAVEEAGKLPC